MTGIPDVSGQRGYRKMCLAKAFINNSSRQPILEDIARVRIHKDRVELETLFGEGKVIPGRVVEIDFSNSKILLDKYYEANKP